MGQDGRGPSTGLAQVGNTLVGGVILFVGSVLLIGPMATLSFLAIAVICTLGLSLLVLLPLAWAIGWVATATFQAIRRAISPEPWDPESR